MRAFIRLAAIVHGMTESQGIGLGSIRREHLIEQVCLGDVHAPELRLNLEDTQQVGLGLDSEMETKVCRSPWTVSLGIALLRPLFANVTARVSAWLRYCLALEEPLCRGEPNISRTSDSLQPARPTRTAAVRDGSEAARCSRLGGVGADPLFFTGR